MRTEQTGWRQPSRVIFNTQIPDDTDKSDLYRLARLAGQALRFSTGMRFVLDKLIGCFKESVSGRLLVWPSNEFLMKETGLSERGVRYAVKNLIDAGVVTAKDSANGKRFAIRSKSGQIIDAFGLDLSPLPARSAEFEKTVQGMKDRQESRKRQFDAITVLKRDARAMLEALEELNEPLGSLRSAFDEEVGMLPRRDSSASPEASLARWRHLRDTIQERYAACGGNICRIIEDNNEAPDQSCNKARKLIDLSELQAACPNAFEFTYNLRDEADMITWAAKLRGGFGVHESAWHEARDKLGPPAAATSFFAALEHYCRDQDQAQKIRNFGGFFRSYMRRVAEGEIDLAEEILSMRRRRQN